MKKLVILSLIAPAILGLAACTPPANNTAVELNVTSDDNTVVISNDTMIENDAAPIGNAM